MEEHCSDKRVKRINALYMFYYSLLYHRAKGILHIPVDAEDAVQNVFIKVQNYIDRFTDNPSDDQNRMLLLVMVKHASIDIFKHRKPIVSISELDEDTIGNMRDVDQEILTAGAIKTLLGDLRAHNKKAAEAFLLQQQGFSHKEIAEILGVSEGHSRRLTSQAKKHMRENAAHRNLIITLIIILALVLASCGYIFRGVIKEFFELCTSYFTAQDNFELPDDIEIGYIVDEYELLVSEVNSDLGLFIYENENEQQYTIVIERTKTVFLDTENSVVHSFYLNGYLCEIHTFIDKDTKVILFLDEVTIAITGLLTEDEILEILTSIKL